MMNVSGSIGWPYPPKIKRETEAAYSGIGYGLWITYAGAFLSTAGVWITRTTWQTKWLMQLIVAAAMVDT